MINSLPLWLFMVALSGCSTTVNTEPSSTGCSTQVVQAAADIVFLLDGSGSVTADQFLIMKTFVKNMTRSLLPYDTLFAFAQYSGGFTKHVDFNQFSRTTFESQLDNIVQMRGSTYTARAMEKVVQDMFNSSVGARAGAKRLLIVITDGQSSDSASYPSVTAQADASNITRYAIGVGSAWSSQSARDELKAIASKPESGHSFEVTNFSGLEQIRKSLEKKILTVSVECPPGWTQNGTRCFKFVSTKRTWAESELYCVMAGGNLASVHSGKENSFIQELVRKHTHNPPFTWIGGCDAAQEGLWLWSDGSSFDYSHWKTGQPDNSVTKEHCAHTYNRPTGSLGWNDLPCDQQYPSVCALDPI